MKLPLYFSRIRMRILKWVSGIGFLVSLMGMVSDRDTWFISVSIGIGFGYALFSVLVLSQKKILIEQAPSNFIIGYLLRLLIYATPISLAFIFEDYLNLYIILLFLFLFQFCFIALEYFRNYKRFKRRFING